MTAPATVVSAIDTDQIKNFSIPAIAVVALVGLVVIFLVSSVVSRLITVIVVIVLGAAIYQQRDHVTKTLNEAAKKCDISFFGFHIQPSDPNIKKACDAAAHQTGGGK